MNNQERNLRTLIACFVIALVALVPLRIMESQNLTKENVMVLGEEDQFIEEEFYDDGYVEEEIIDEGEMVLGEEDQFIEEEFYDDGYVEEEIELPSAEIE